MAQYAALRKTANEIRKTMEGDFRWHGQAPDDEQLQLALAQLGGCA